MIRAVVIDDELAARKTLLLLLKPYEGIVEVVGEASSVKEAIQLIDESKPDLVFLDIEMQDGTGFDVLEALTEINFHLVFVTAFEQYALHSFRYAAIDYLLKPVRIQELRESIHRASTWSKPQTKTGKEFANLKSTVEKIDPNKEKDQVILISDQDGFIIIKREEIIYCEAAKNYTIFKFAGGQKVATRSLGEFEELLTTHGFLRIHKSYMINLNKVSKYLKGRGGEVEMVNNEILPVSREKKAVFLEYFEAKFGGL